MHFLEDARFPKAPGFSEALSKLLLYAPRSQLTTSPPHITVFGHNSAVLRAVKCLGPETTTMFSFA